MLCWSGWKSLYSGCSSLAKEELVGEGFSVSRTAFVVFPVMLSLCELPLDDMIQGIWEVKPAISVEPHQEGLFEVDSVQDCHSGELARRSVIVYSLIKDILHIAMAQTLARTHHNVFHV